MISSLVSLLSFILALTYPFSSTLQKLSHSAKLTDFRICARVDDTHDDETELVAWPLSFEGWKTYLAKV